jgi:signal peptidase I
MTRAPTANIGASFESRVRRAGALVLWFAIPAVATLAVVAYLAGMLVWHANPPIVPVAGVSMRPTLQAGDVVVLKGADPKLLEKGDIVAVRVPPFARQKYHLPGAVVHRIVQVRHDASGLFFRTKGDANPGADVFVVREQDVVGRMVKRLPGFGYPVLFFRSKQGRIFLGVAALVLVLYFVLRFFDERRAYVVSTAAVVQTVLAETREVKQALATGAAVPARGPPESERLALPAEPESWQRPDGPPLDLLTAEIRRNAERSQETSRVLGDLLVAVQEYGEHLRSHTAVMKGLAATTDELSGAARELRSAIAAPTGGPGRELARRGARAVVRRVRASAPPSVGRRLDRAMATIESRSRRANGAGAGDAGRAAAPAAEPHLADAHAEVHELLQEVRREREHLASTAEELRALIESALAILHEQATTPAPADPPDQG